MIEVMFGWLVSFLSGTSKKEQQFLFSLFSSQHNVILIPPKATASSLKEKFQVPAKHLLLGTSTVLVPIQEVYLFIYSSSFCSCHVSCKEWSTTLAHEKMQKQGGIADNSPLGKKGR